jgi:hypothetical protein
MQMTEIYFLTARGCFKVYSGIVWSNVLYECYITWTGVKMQSMRSFVFQKYCFLGGVPGMLPKEREVEDYSGVEILRVPRRTPELE